jgi:hypothetical protein
MRKSVGLLVGALLVAGLAMAAFANSESVTGQLIDLSCYAHDKSNTGNAHKDKGLICAQACAREGFAVGVLTPDGKVYQLVGALTANSNAKLVPHMAQTVTISGEVTEKDGRLTIAADDLR